MKMSCKAAKPAKGMKKESKHEHEKEKHKRYSKRELSKAHKHMKEHGG